MPSKSSLPNQTEVNAGEDIVGYSKSSVPCAQCGKPAVLIQVPEKIPLFGDILVQTIACPHCGFKWSDVMSTEFGEPKGFEVHIRNEKDLHVKIVRNSSGTVEIPELGILLEPGPFAEGFFTNMEGLLERMGDVLSTLTRSHDSKQAAAAKERMLLLRKCQAGKTPFTVRVLDPVGGSALLGSHVKRWKLSSAEVKKLKMGVQFT